MMNNCFCGNPIEDNGILCTRCTALRVLELDSRATEKQIKDAYRMMIKVWHPDRFQGDESLRWSAEQKLKLTRFFLSNPRTQNAVQNRHL
jgi:hypothetical protein